MSDTVIRVENLGKKYIIGHQKHERYTALRDVIANRARGLFSGGKSQAEVTEEFWALKDVSFEIKQGDRVGIIGRNGAGKSTLLKILSRITEPTEGRISIKGRVASLLEVGTGFHPELTGRENIYLNGAILGMSRVEIKRKFDEIVAFAEVEKFLDTPVKRYSSGMYVRLAFAVAAHLEPEILVVDEVLAVGDLKFQEKCLGKMQELSKTGKTLLFVSHNITAITNLCSKAILLKRGNLSSYGLIDSAINDYLGSQNEKAASDLSVDCNARKGSGEIRLISSIIESPQGLDGNIIKINDPLNITLVLKKIEIINNPNIMISIYDHVGGYIAHMNTEISGYDVTLNREIINVKCCVPCFNLVPKQYRINVAIMKNQSIIDHVIDACLFTVVDKDVFGTGKIPHAGFLILAPTWHVE